MHHLAQVNIAKMVAPLDDPVMAGFVAQLESVNAIAEASPGFVWRLKDEGGDATSVRVFDDDAILVNMSMWESVASLHQYAYRSGHGPVLRDRAKWFTRMPEAHLAMWWVPAGETPTVERYEHVTEAGQTRAGECVSVVEPLTDGRLRLHEAWWWRGSAPRPRQYSALVDAAA
jgi:hypothetical protein